MGVPSSGLAGTWRFSIGCLPARKVSAVICSPPNANCADYTRAELGFYSPIAMEGTAWFALFSTVFLACQGRGQGKVYFSFSN